MRERATPTRRDVDLLDQSVPDVSLRDAVGRKIPGLGLIPSHQGGVVRSNLEVVAEQRTQKSQPAVDASLRRKREGQRAKKEVRTHKSAPTRTPEAS